MSDGAAVYEKADFDSKVIDFLPYQAAVNVSTRAFTGVGGMGLFHRIRVKNRIGYIPDTDIRIGSKAREQRQKATAQRPKVDDGAPKSKAWSDDEDTPPPGRGPIYLTRYLGGAISQVNYTEKFEGRKLSDDILMYGMRMTGPGVLFDGPPLDFNFWFSFDKPEYYNRFSSGISGFLLFGDIMAMMPMVNLDDWSVTYGLGLMWTYTKFRMQVTKAGSNMPENADSMEFRMGLAAGLGVSRRLFKTYQVRADVKYYYEKTQYLGYVLSLQREY